MVDGFADDAELVLEESRSGAARRGRAAIAAAYRDQPPDDEIELLNVDQDGEGQVVASYAGPSVPASGQEHSSAPRRRGGSLVW